MTLEKETAMLKNFWEKVKAFYVEAKSKLSTYIGLAIAALPQIHDNFADISQGWGGWLHAHQSTIYSALGIAVIWARVRRELSTPK